MPGSILDIILNVLRKGRGAEETKKELSGVEKAAQTAGKALLTFVSVESIKATFELAKLGAQSLRTKQAFEAISGGADEASANLEAMQAATRGALSEQQAMASANQLMQMGLANSSEELAQLAEMATRLGGAMGKDATASLEEFSLLLANQSIPRLDTFGISAGKVRTRINELTSTVAGMTREQAFMTAVMEEGQTSMERLGPAVDDAALSFERAEAMAVNLRTELGERLAPAISTALDAGMLLLTWNEQIAEAQREHAESVVITAASYEEYIAELTRAAGVTDMVVNAEGHLVEVQQVRGHIVERLVQENFALSEAEFGVARAVDAVRQTVDSATVGWANASDVIRGSTDSTLQAAAASREFAAAQAQSAQDSAALAQSLKDATSSQIASRLIGMLDPEKLGGEAYSEVVAEIGTRFGLMDDESIALAENMGALAEAIESGVIPAENADDALIALIDDAKDGRVDIENLTDEFRDLSGWSLSAGAGMRDAAGGMQGIARHQGEAVDGIANIGSSAATASGQVGGFADELGTTEAKLAALVAGSPWNIQVRATSGSSPGLDIPPPGGGGTTTTDNRQFSNRVSITNIIQDPMTAQIMIEEQRRLLAARLARGF